MQSILSLVDERTSLHKKLECLCFYLQIRFLELELQPSRHYQVVFLISSKP